MTFEVAIKVLGKVAVKVFGKIDPSTAHENQAILPRQVRRESENLTILQGYNCVAQTLSCAEGVFDVLLVLELHDENLHTYIRPCGFHG